MVTRRLLYVLKCTEMYWTHNEGNPTFAERFIISLKTKCYIFMTSVSETYIDFKKKIIKNILNLMLVIMKNILKYKVIFAKIYLQNYSEDVFCDQKN